jgi:hypothetical protein
MVPEPQAAVQNQMYSGASYTIAEAPQGAMTYTSKALGLLTGGGDLEK